MMWRPGLFTADRLELNLAVTKQTIARKSLQEFRCAMASYWRMCK